MKFVAGSTPTSFGGHETFGLRYTWLSKGYQALTANPKVFHDDDATVTLGVGKNMVASIRYWMTATRMIDPSTGLASPLGKMILDPETGFDPFLEDEATLWLLHWLLATNASRATSFYWFFNKFHKPEFTQEELLTALKDWAKANVQAKPSVNTLKRDASLLPRMYSTTSRGIGRLSLEDALDNPLSELRLLSSSPGGRAYQSRLLARPGLPTEILGFAISELMNARESLVIPIEDLMYSRDDFAAPGAVFRLTEADLVAKLENLVALSDGNVQIRESAGIHQLYFEEVGIPLNWLTRYYQHEKQEAAA